jgi:hypothetical protein
MVVAAILHSLLEPAMPYLRLITGVGSIPLAP